MPLAGSFDSSVADCNPFVGIWSPIARQTAAGTVLGRSESLAREEASRLQTVRAARAIREEANRGTIAVGMLADFVFIDRDILNCPTNAIRAITPIRTILGGRDVVALGA